MAPGEAYRETMEEETMGERANSDAITRDYLDSILLEPRYVDTDLASTEIELFGETFQTPIMTAALSHLHKICDNAMAEFGLGAKEAGALHFYGMGEDEELEQVIATGAKTVKIIKPHADDAEVFRRIRHAQEHGAFAVGMDIDHAIRWDGQFDEVLGLAMRPKTTEQLAAYVQATELPFIVKGVLSVTDAKKLAEIGVKGIILSHHHNVMSYCVPPLMVLPEIRKAVGNDMKIFVDCGIVSGMDVFKALALGADAVGVGRALMGPLSEGHAGVRNRILEMNRELAATMARTGAKTVAEIDPSVIHMRSFPW